MKGKYIAHLGIVLLLWLLLLLAIVILVPAIGVLLISLLPVTCSRSRGRLLVATTPITAVVTAIAAAIPCALIAAVTARAITRITL